MSFVSVTCNQKSTMYYKLVLSNTPLVQMLFLSDLLRDPCPSLQTYLLTPTTHPDQVLAIMLAPKPKLALFLFPLSLCLSVSFAWNSHLSFSTRLTLTGPSDTD